MYCDVPHQLIEVPSEDDSEYWTDSVMEKSEQSDSEMISESE